MSTWHTPELTAHSSTSLSYYPRWLDAWIRSPSHRTATSSPDEEKESSFCWEGEYSCLGHRLSFFDFTGPSGAGLTVRAEFTGGLKVLLAPGADRGVSALEGRLGAGLTVRLKQPGSLEGYPAGAGGVQPGFAGRLLAGMTVRLKQPGSLEGCPAGAGGVPPGFAGRLLAGLAVRLKQPDSLEGCSAGAGGVQPGFCRPPRCWFDGETEAG